METDKAIAKEFLIDGQLSKNLSFTIVFLINYSHVNCYMFRQCIMLIKGVGPPCTLSL